MTEKTGNVHFEMRVRPKEGTEDHHLIEYLRTRSRTVKETVWETVGVYWSALAFQKSGAYGREEVLRQGLLSVATLRAQIRYIKEVLELEDEIDEAVDALVAELEKRSFGVPTLAGAGPGEVADEGAAPGAASYDNNLF